MVFRSSSRPFPGFSSIYELSETGSTRAFRASIDLEDEFGATRAEIKPSGRVQARWAMGNKVPSDIVWTTDAVPMLVSERVVTMLRDTGFRGWGSYGVELTGHDGTLVTGYYGLSVHGRCGPLDDTKSVEIPKIFPGGVFPVWLGLYFDPDTWDGSDVFMPAGGDSGFILVVEGVMRAFKKARIGNVRFTPLPEIEMDRATRSEGDDR